MSLNEMLHSDHIVQALQNYITSGEHGLEGVPKLIKRIIKEDRWQCRFSEVWKKEVTFKSFEQFVTTPLTDGLGASVQILKNLCRDDVEAINLIDEKTVIEGRPKSNSNRMTLSHQGTTSQYALRKLRKSAPELHARVLAGELSPHRAMIEAGFRKETITIPLEIKAVARAIKKHFKLEDIEILKKLLARERLKPNKTLRLASESHG